VRSIYSSGRRNAYLVETLSKGLKQKRGLSFLGPGKGAINFIPLFIYVKTKSFNLLVESLVVMLTKNRDVQTHPPVLK
jgi:hypothetical protein